MKIKPTVIYHYTPARGRTLKQLATRVGKDVMQLELLYTANQHTKLQKQLRKQFDSFLES